MTCEHGHGNPNSAYWVYLALTGIRSQLPHARAGTKAGTRGRRHGLGGGTLGGARARDGANAGPATSASERFP